MTVGRNQKRPILLPLLGIVLGVLLAQAQNANERSFGNPKPEIEKALKSLQPISGRLPTLDGFVEDGNRNLDQYQRGYYDCEITVVPLASGGATVRVKAKITAWHQSPTAGKSGYETLPSNGRVELDLLDRLTEALQRSPIAIEQAGSNPTVNSRPTASSSSSASASTAAGASRSPEPTLTAPMPQLPALNNPLTGSAMSAPTQPSRSGDLASQRVADRRLASLVNEEKGLEEVLKNQSHPTNLAAVKQHGAPVLVSPSDGAKVLFTAAAEDEFEILDQNVSWVHVRISGLYRGWIARSNLEMPEDAGKSEAAASPSELFHVTNEQIVQFPGDWDPLRGKTVKIVSVQATGDAVVGWRAKRDYAKSAFLKDYDALAASGGESGEVLVFDAQDGGMIAATLSSVKQWRDKAISDDDFWKGCYFDPPETFGVQPSQ
jgi:hypothetical protein